MTDKKVKYEWTGEYRETKIGDFVFQGGPPMEIRKGDAVLHSGFRYWILRRVEVSP